MEEENINEVWKYISGYENRYQVSNVGRIKSLLTHKILKLIKATNNYLVVSLYKNKEKKMFYVHRLVAEIFISNPNNLPEVNHKDENKENNYVDNLEWCTKKYNTTYGTRIERIANKKRGVHKSLEAKQKISETRIKNNLAKEENNPNCKKVICLTTGEIFNYIKQATEKYGLYKDSIGGCCKGKFKYAGKLKDGSKLIWMYYEDYIKIINEKGNL